MMFVTFICWAILANYPSANASPTPFLKSNLETRVTNGYNASRLQFPYQVSVQYDYGLNMQFWDHVCGGAIISRTYVLTAAHCKFLDGNMKIVAGITNLGEQAQERQDILAAEVIHYPTYPINDKTVTFGDIALIRLATALVWSRAVQPVSISQHNSESGNAILTGWGEISSNSVLAPVTLQWAQVPILSTTVCANTVRSLSPQLADAPFDNTIICTNTRSTTSPVSACNGDSGGPLVQNGVIIGVVSWGISPCGEISNAPTMYTRVASYALWIAQYVTDL
ncbi:trypsin alpha-like [Agrilus planipennis]|uniref:Trypsin alpha-like n=1 Tax=Agrilus planipennis TaxID=224129 RepID=A0A1W4WID6_AGRPL|nr:trypsin alpha-like [Agrilus planipennis]